MSDLGSTRPDRGRPRRSERRDEQRRILRRERLERAEADRQERLDQPKDTRRLRRPRFEDDAFGRFAEQFARFMGTARFLLYMTGFVAIWLLWNVFAPTDVRFDPYAFIFLTLMLSLQASYAAPLILLAQNRQEDRDRVIAEQDRLDNSRAHADMEFLAREMASLRLALGEVATRDYVRSELRSLLSEIGDRLPAEEDGDEGNGAHGPGGASEERHTPSA